MIFAMKHNDSKEIKNKAEGYFQKMLKNERYFSFSNEIINPLKLILLLLINHHKRYFMVRKRIIFSS